MTLLFTLVAWNILGTIAFIWYCLSNMDNPYNTHPVRDFLVICACGQIAWIFVLYIQVNDWLRGRKR